MGYLGVIGFIFGIFGLLAYLEQSSMKKRIMELERALAAVEGTSYSENARSFVKAAEAYIGKDVKIEFKEDCGDFDIINYGNTKHGSCIINDVDGEWMIVRVVTSKKSFDKLIRTDSVLRISPKAEK